MVYVRVRTEIVVYQCKALYQLLTSEIARIFKSVVI